MLQTNLQLEADKPKQPEINPQGGSNAILFGKKGHCMVRIFMGIYRKFAPTYSFVIFQIIRKSNRVSPKVAMEWKRVHNYSNSYNRFQ